MVLLVGILQWVKHSTLSIWLQIFKIECKYRDATIIPLERGRLLFKELLSKHILSLDMNIPAFFYIANMLQTGN